MEKLSHPRIVRMFETIETPRRLHLVLECVEGSNLCSYVKAKRKLSEEEARQILFQLLQALEYIHSQHIAHRDIKLENVLFDEDHNIKLIDFGFSVACKDRRLKVFCGTPSYMAPEIVRRMDYEGPPVDMWSAGVVMYALLCGKARDLLRERVVLGNLGANRLRCPVLWLLARNFTVVLGRIFPVQRSLVSGPLSEDLPRHLHHPGQLVAPGTGPASSAAQPRPAAKTHCRSCAEASMDGILCDARQQKTAGRVCIPDL